MGVTWNSVDLETTYGFTLGELDGIASSSIVIGTPEVRRYTMVAPKRTGVLFFGQEYGPRKITMRGYIQGSSFADLYSKIKGLNSKFDSTLSAHPSPSDFAAPTVSEVDLVIPGITADKFPNCVPDSFKVEYVQARLNSVIAMVNITVQQNIPRTAAV